jgi:hypothetical protein
MPPAQLFNNVQMILEEKELLTRLVDVELE